MNRLKKYFAQNTGLGVLMKNTKTISFISQDNKLVKSHLVPLTTFGCYAKDTIKAKPR
jgi:hypothetical protein